MKVSAGAAVVVVLGGALGCNASRAFFLAMRGSPLFIAQWACDRGSRIQQIET